MPSGLSLARWQYMFVASQKPELDSGMFARCRSGLPTRRRNDRDLVADGAGVAVDSQTGAEFYQRIAKRLCCRSWPDLKETPTAWRNRH